MDEQEQVYCDIRELAKMGGVCVKTLFNWVYSGRLVPIKGHTGMIGKSPRRHCYLFLPAHLQQVRQMRTAMHWGSPSI